MSRCRLSLSTICLAMSLALPTGGCGGSSGPGERGGRGPGYREQSLALTPEQELSLGRQAYQEILRKYEDKGEVLPRSASEVQRVRTVGERIARASAIEPLQREINLHLKGYPFDWTFNVLEDRRINAFCLPGGFVAVYTGILKVVQNDDQLATVMSHEIAHALAHHASERLAEHQMLEHARTAAAKGLGSLGDETRRVLVGLLSAGGELQGLAHSRFQESEADHIGVFLMTFAGYNPEQAVVFWERMAELSSQRGRPPELLSDHPSDERRLQQLRAWVPLAEGGKKAYDEGRIAPPR